MEVPRPRGCTRTIPVTGPHGPRRISVKTPHAHRLQGGYTLIELLVVIGIIALLAAALLGPIVGVQTQAHKTADQMALRWHYSQLELYRAQRGHYPRQEGHKFVLAPWVEGVVEHTEANRDRYFSAALGDDAHIIDLRSRPVDEIWKSFDKITSLDTHFAGRSLDNRRRMMSGKEVWMATDNEGGNTYLDGSVLLLRGDGSVKEVPRIPDQIKFGAPSDPDVEYSMEVGPASPHPDLRKLRR